MTEYDYSPGAYERHLANQARIAKWVDHTNAHPKENPFVPLPGEHLPSPAPESDGGYSPPSASQVGGPSGYGGQQGQMYGVQQQGYPSYPSPYGYGYQVQPQVQAQAQPAFYTTPQGLISPTYFSTSTSRPKGSRSRHSHKSSSSSRIPTQAQLAYPAYPTPTNTYPVSAPAAGSGSYVDAHVAAYAYANGGRPGQTYVYGTSPYTAQPQQATAYPYTAYPYTYGTQSAQTSPYPSPPLYPTVIAAAPMSRSSSRSRSKSHSRPSSSRSHSHQGHSPQSFTTALTSMSMLTPTGTGVQCIQPTANQPVIVPMNGGYVVVPAKGQDVQVVTPQYQTQTQYQYQPQYHSKPQSEDTQSFFGSLSIGSGMKLPGLGLGSLRFGKKGKRSRRGSF